MNVELKNRLNYVALAFIAGIIGALAALVPQLMSANVTPINYYAVLGVGISAFLTAYGGSQLPRDGSAGLARKVDRLRKQNIPRTEMTVVEKPEATRTN